MPFGYWHDEGAIWGDWRSETGFTNLYLNGFYVTADQAAAEKPKPGKPRSWAPVQAKAFRDAIAAGKEVLVNLHMTNILRVPTPKTCAQLAPYWDKVIGLDMADEPPREWESKETVRELVEGVRRTVETEREVAGVKYNLPQKPLGVTLEYRTQVFGPMVKWFVDAGIDFFCLEAYVTPPGPTSPTKAAQQLRENLSKQIDRIPQDKKIVVVLQSYSRNGAWDAPLGTDPSDYPNYWTATTGLASLEEVNREALKMALELGSRCMAVTAFAYGRPSGVVHNPSLKPIHKDFVTQHGGA